MSITPNVENQIHMPVMICKMTESCGVTYWVLLRRIDRDVEKTNRSERGSITPFRHENLDYVKHEAKVWAKFLGVEVDYQGEYDDEYYATHEKEDLDFLDTIDGV